ncbi:MAG TPA: glycosyltransferase [Tepidisphaeraceae bacterium]|jgi:glycosyltransferase involved in cell wall biosynthesis|nr:glycosyltransferase [Tepidisphaeraceae bacterium]
MSLNAQGQSVTVIIPAHNEEQALPPTLGSLMAQDFAGQLRIVVVPNGCDDRTAQVARSFIPKAQKRGFELVVAELSEGCKPKALNQGDVHAIPNSIRIYVDADIRLSRNAISAVARELREGSGTHCAAPRIQVAPAKSWVTRAYLKVWLNTPYIKNDVICGFYGVSAEGRRRWDKFPIIIADDKFTRMQFARHERKVAQDATMTIQYAEGLKELIKVRTRWTRGNIELAMVYPQLWKRDEGRYTRTVPHLLSKPTVWPCIPFFALVYAWGWWIAFKTRKANLSTWERSNGSRARLATT